MINNMNKFSDVKKEIKCPHCKSGTRKLRLFYVQPKTGRVGIEYSWCSKSFCEGKHNLIVWTYIIIPELKLGDNNE